MALYAWNQTDDSITLAMAFRTSIIITFLKKKLLLKKKITTLIFCSSPNRR